MLRDCRFGETRYASDKQHCNDSWAHASSRKSANSSANAGDWSPGDMPGDAWHDPILWMMPQTKCLETRIAMIAKNAEQSLLRRIPSMSCDLITRN